LDKYLTGSHETTGIDIYVTPERFILLDTQVIIIIFFSHSLKK